MELKEEFFPEKFASCTRRLDKVLEEIKGSDLRAAYRRQSRKRKRFTTRFIGRLLDSLERHDAKLVGSVWIKPIGGTGSNIGLYTCSVQAVCESFQTYLEEKQDQGIVIADNRTFGQNTALSHSIFTQKFKWDGDGYDRMVELPTFGNSRNHIGLQICDILCSALVWPIAVVTYCSGHIRSNHVHPGYQTLKKKFARRLKNLQYRYQDNGLWKGGLWVNDGLARRNGSYLFKRCGPTSGRRKTAGTKAR